MDWTWCTFTLWHLSLTHHLCIFLILIQDLMKSEERQKLAKERREEKAKYLGEWKQGVGGQARCILRELPLVLGWKRLLLCVSCVTTGLAPGCWWYPHAEGEKNSLGFSTRSAKAKPPIYQRQASIHFLVSSVKTFACCISYLIVCLISTLTRLCTKLY